METEWCILSDRISWRARAPADKTRLLKMVMSKYGLEGKLHEEHQLIKDGILREDNPLDQSTEFNEFLLACRHADLRKCQELINVGVNINGKDKFDYTPLIIVSGSFSIEKPRV